MATVQSIKQSTNSRIRSKNAPNSVNTGDVADNIDLVVDEVRRRGFKKVSSTSGLPTVHGGDTLFAMVENFGMFEYSPTGTANGTTVFDAQTTGTWNLVATFAEDNTDRITATGNYEYSLDSAYQIDEIKIKPSVNSTLKIGTTPGGEEVLMEEAIPANVRKSVSMKIFGDESPSVFFTGITASTEITIYKKRQ